jgi:hypothetical protein
MSEWISVEDKLPEEFEGVICYLENEGMIIGSLHDNMKWIDDYGYPLRVTYWMPLPEKPNE